MQQRTLTSFDPVTEAWTNRSAMNASRFDFPLVSFEDRLYAIGGASYNGTTFPNRTVVPSIEVYDPTNDTWTFLRNMSSPRMGARGAVVNGEILIIGGHAGTSASSTVTAFRPSDGSIANRPNLPHATYGHAKNSIRTSNRLPWGSDGLRTVFHLADGDGSCHCVGS